MIPGFHPDPSVCRVGEDYFVACSSFEYFPGVPIYRSRDLRSWRLIANALDRPEQLALANAAASGGIFAPTLRHHAGRFWLATTNASQGTHLIFTASRPAGPWSAPLVVDGAPGIDPDLTWDSAGTCWFTYSSGATGRSGSIEQARIDLTTGRLLEPPTRLWSGTGLQHPEAPHLYDVDGTWYLLIAEGGTERGHAVSVARGPTPGGPFEGAPHNPILSHRSTDHPVQNTGHADLVQRPDGGWAALLLGVRPGGRSPGFHVLGRETFLALVEWVDGWPKLGPIETIDDAHQAEGSSIEHFDEGPLDPQWLSVRARPAGSWSLRERPGSLTLHATGHSLDETTPAFVGRRQQHPRCTTRAAVDASSGVGGLVVRMDECHHYEVQLGAREIRCHARIGPVQQTLAFEACKTDAVVLRIEIEPNRVDDDRAFGPDVVRLGYEEDERFIVLAALDGRYLSTEVATGFTGRVIGMYAAAGAVAFDWFEYRALPPAAGDAASGVCDASP